MGHWNPQRKMRVASHCFKVISLGSQQKCWHQHFSEKKRKLRIFLNSLLHTEKKHRIINVLKLLENVFIKTIFGMFLITKSSQQLFWLLWQSYTGSAKTQSVPHNQKLITCWTGLSLPFHNMKCRGNHMLLKVIAFLKTNWDIDKRNKSKTKRIWQPIYNHLFF